MTKFSEAWKKLITASTKNNDDISFELEQKIMEIYEVINAEEIHLEIIKQKLEQLFIYLSSPFGRKDNNIKITDLFFCAGEGWRFDRLPEKYREIAADIGGALHDSIDNPDVASNFNSLPEQILIRIRNL